MNSNKKYKLLTVVSLVFFISHTPFYCVSGNESDEIISMYYIQFKNGETSFVSDAAPYRLNDSVVRIMPIDLKVDLESIDEEGATQLALAAAKEEPVKVSRKKQAKKLIKLLKPTKKRLQKTKAVLTQLVKSLNQGKMLTPSQKVIFLNDILPKLKKMLHTAHESAAKSMQPSLKSAKLGAKAGAISGSGAGVVIGSIDPGFGNLLGAGIGAAAGTLIGAFTAGGATFLAMVGKDVAKVAADEFLVAE
jgi:hypothetical protein